jgi:uncharacterized protein (TIGR02594 family)
MKIITLILSTALLVGCDIKFPTIIKTQEIRVERTNAAMIAFQYIDYSEATHRQKLKDYIGVDPKRTEWCAAFANAVLKETGVPGSESVSDYPLTARSFLQWGEEVKEPQPGDIIVFPRGKVAWQGHVGFYIKSQTIDGIEYYYILGGNQSNKVSIDLYRASRALSIRRHSS